MKQLRRLNGDIFKMKSINIKNSNMSNKLDFGDHALIEQKQYGVPNEMYLYKVIRRFNSNYYVDVPVQSPAKEVHHEKVVDVISCICCGVQETEVLKYRMEDVKTNNIYKTEKN